MIKILVASLALSAASLAISDVAYAHGGRTNAQGCHNDSKNGGYHCHNGGSARAAPKKRQAAKPKPKAKPKQAVATVYYANCAEAHAAGVTPLYRGQPGYRSQMDGDNDGVACERGGARGSGSRQASGGGTGSGNVSPSKQTIVVPAPVPVPASPTYAPVGLLSKVGDGARVIEGTAVVTDGDSLTINGERIRLFGIDAFEAEQLCGSGLRCGAKATQHLAELIGPKPVTCVQRDTDSYGRIVGVCTVGGIDLNAAMVRAGWAIAYRQYSQDYVSDEDFAKANRLGAHSGPFDNPQDFRRGTGSATAIAQRNTAQAGACIIKGNINAKGEKIYHLPGQSGYQKVKPEAMFCTVEEAEAAGFRARKR